MLDDEAVATILLSVCMHEDVQAPERRRAFEEIKRQLSLELRTLSGRRFDVVTRDDAPYGERKQSFLAGKLARALFFVPVLEPYYFRDPLCRQELAEFLRREGGASPAVEHDALVSRLIVPIQWIDISQTELPADCREVLKLAPAPWQGLRMLLESPAQDRADGRPVSQAIEKVARRLVDFFLEERGRAQESTAKEAPVADATRNADPRPKLHESSEDGASLRQLLRRIVSSSGDLHRIAVVHDRNGDALGEMPLPASLDAQIESLGDYLSRAGQDDIVLRDVLVSVFPRHAGRIDRGLVNRASGLGGAYLLCPPADFSIEVLVARLNATGAIVATPAAYATFISSLRLFDRFLLLHLPWETTVGTGGVWSSRCLAYSHRLSWLASRVAAERTDLNPAHRAAKLLRLAFFSPIELRDVLRCLRAPPQSIAYYDDTLSRAIFEIEDYHGAAYVLSSLVTCLGQMSPHLAQTCEAVATALSSETGVEPNAALTLELRAALQFSLLSLPAEMLREELSDFGVPSRVLARIPFESGSRLSIACRTLESLRSLGKSIRTFIARIEVRHRGCTAFCEPSFWDAPELDTAFAPPAVAGDRVAALVGLLAHLYPSFVDLQIEFVEEMAEIGLYVSVGSADWALRDFVKWARRRALIHPGFFVKLAERWPGARREIEAVFQLWQPRFPASPDVFVSEFSLRGMLDFLRERATWAGILELATELAEKVGSEQLGSLPSIGCALDGLALRLLEQVQREMRHDELFELLRGRFPEDHARLDAEQSQWQQRQRQLSTEWSTFATPPPIAEEDPPKESIPLPPADASLFTEAHPSPLEPADTRVGASDDCLTSPGVRTSS